MGILDQLSVRPWWAAGQLDPTSGDFVPAGGGRDLAGNVTRRSWVLVGNLFAWDRALLDPRGLLTPDGSGWSLDWWIGAEDRWYVPAHEEHVRQHLVDATPVVETLVKVPGGDLAHRVVGVSSPVAGAGGFALVEIENRTAVPVAVALAVRPYGPLGATPIRTIDLADNCVLVDDEPAVVFARAPLRCAVSGTADLDVADLVRAGDAVVEWPGAVEADAVGDAAAAQAAFIFPLPHTAVLRAVVPLGDPRPVATPAGARGGRRTRRDPTEPGMSFPDALPGSAQVAAGWATQRDRGVRLALPPSAFAEAVTANRAWLLLFAGGEDLVTRPERACDLAETADVLATLGAFGFHDEVEAIVRTWPERQLLDGHFETDGGRLDANGAALAAAARHAQLSGDATFAEDLVGCLAKGAHWIDKRRTGRRGRRHPDGPGLLPAGPGPGWLVAAGTDEQWFRDDAWALRGLTDAAGLFVALDQPEVAADVQRFADGLGADLATALLAAGAACGGELPAAPGRRLDRSVLGTLEVARLLDGYVGLPREVAGGVSALLEGVRTAVGRLASPEGTAAVVHPVPGAGVAGYSPALTAELALLDVLHGDPVAHERLDWLLAVGGPTSSWPTVVHPRTGHGSAGEGHHGLACARFLTLARSLLVHEHALGLAFLPLVPPAWLGQGVEVHGLPTRFGALSFALRWYDDRPALLWELEPHALAPTTPPVLSAPGLDPTWSADVRKGDAVLAPVAGAADRPRGVTMPVTLGRRAPRGGDDS